MAWSCLKDGRCKYYKNSPKMDTTRETAGRKTKYNIWRQTVEGELKDLKMTWGEAKNEAKNRA